MRIFFATDVHGSETCWRKFLNSGKHYKADVIILGGDMTGKALVPIIADGDDSWHATLLENRESPARARSRSQRSSTRSNAAATTRSAIDPDELAELAKDEVRWHALFDQHMLTTVATGWPWPTSGWPVPESAASSAPATTISSRSTT